MWRCGVRWVGKQRGRMQRVCDWNKVGRDGVRVVGMWREDVDGVRYAQKVHVKARSRHSRLGQAGHRAGPGSFHCVTARMFGSQAPLPSSDWLPIQIVLLEANWPRLFSLARL